MLDVTYTADALKDLRGMGHVAAGKVRDKVLAYAAKPSAFGNQIKRLKGSGYLRLRAGDYRVVFTEDGIIMEIIHVGHRREVYR